MSLQHLKYASWTLKRKGHSNLPLADPPVHFLVCTVAFSLNWCVVPLVIINRVCSSSKQRFQINTINEKTYPMRKCCKCVVGWWHGKLLTSHAEDWPLRSASSKRTPIENNREGRQWQNKPPIQEIAVALKIEGVNNAHTFILSLSQLTSLKKALVYSGWVMVNLVTLVWL